MCEMESDMAVYGYARVSTDGQSLAAQLAELKGAKCEKIFREKISGARSDRKQLAKLMALLAKGDVLVVTRLDRLARSTRDLLNLLGAPPRALRIAKIYVDFGRQRKATMIRKFLSPVPGQGLIQLLWQLLRLLDERGDCRLGVLTCHLGQHHVTRMTLDQGRDVAVVRPGQQIAFPMARHRPIFNRRRSLTD